MPIRLKHFSTNLKKIDLRLIIGIFLLSFLIGSDILAQVDKVDFNEKAIPPVNYPIRLSGSFGELRNNHYHTGLDIKGKNSTSGDSIVSIFSGYVSRIRIHSGGYGKSVYVDHPNGLTSVYAHLMAYNDEIHKIITDQQFAFKSSEIDFYPKKDSIKIEQGQFLGYLGNTGRSTGPHLHFECRETITELPIDPLIFGFGITDSKSPFVQKLIVHELDSNYQILDRIIKDPGTKSISCNSSLVGIGFKGYDQMDRSYNQNGIAKIKTYLNNRLIYHCEFDTISFNEMKYINASIDYNLKQNGGGKFFMCYKLPSNHIRNIKKIKNNGLIDLKKARNIKIVVEDRAGNKHVSEFNLVLGKKLHSAKAQSDLRQSDQAHNLKFQDLRLDIKAHSFYKPEKFIVDQEKVGHQYHLVIGPEKTACHKYFDLRKVKMDKNLRNKSKVRIFHENSAGKLVNLGGYIKNDTFYCKINRFGKFIIRSDNSPPKISLFSKNAEDHILFKVKDNFETSGKATSLNINCYVNGNWIPSYYKSMNHLLEIKRSFLQKGAELVIIASDNCGNVNRLEMNNF